MEVTSAREPPNLKDEEMVLKNRGAKRDKYALKDITNTTRGEGIALQDTTSGESGKTNETYRSKLLNGGGTPSNVTMEEGDFAMDDVDLDDYCFEGESDILGRIPSLSNCWDTPLAICIYAIESNSYGR
ncbi:hypothetical protein REPUB_Repub15cG0063800 [Reevesia pubescens]